MHFFLSGHTFEISSLKKKLLNFFPHRYSIWIFCTYIIAEVNPQFITREAWALWVSEASSQSSCECALIFQTRKFTIASTFFDLRKIFGRKNQQKTVTILDFFTIFGTRIAVCLLFTKKQDELVVALMTYEDSFLKERLYIKVYFTYGFSIHDAYISVRWVMLVYKFDICTISYTTKTCSCVHVFHAKMAAQL